MADTVIYREETRVEWREVGTGVGPAGPAGLSGEEIDEAIAEAVAPTEAAVDALATDLTAEETARIAGDASLADDLTAEEDARTSADETLTDAVEAETARAVAAEATKAAQGDLDALETDVATRATTTALTAEATARANADTALQTDINTRATSAALTAGLATKADDAATTTALGTKATTTALNTEITNRTNADTALQTDINTRATSAALTSGLALKADASTTTAALALKATTADLATEVTNRTNADTTLQTDVNTRATSAALTTEVNRATAAEALKVNTADLVVERAKLGRVADVVEIGWNHPDDWDRLTPHVMGLDSGAGTLTEWDEEVDITNRVGILSQPGGGEGANTRIAYVAEDVQAANIEVRTSFVFTTAGGMPNGQLGIVLGYYNIAGTRYVYIFWFDIVVGNRGLINGRWWRQRVRVARDHVPDGRGPERVRGRPPSEPVHPVHEVVAGRRRDALADSGRRARDRSRRRPSLLWADLRVDVPCRGCRRSERRRDCRPLGW